ncbi:MAG: alpha/beta fold hydrolase [Spirochaetia bacterium]|nr:alpha/beta fold hydrolase [Spirochaetia bacterium]
MKTLESKIQTIRFNWEGHSILYRKFGSGKPLLLVHGWPFHSGSFEALMFVLGKSFTCFAPDLPGMGESNFHSKTDFTFHGQARFLQCFAKDIIRSPYLCVAHDTGATMARLVALEPETDMTALALLNTEIPGHRPPWIGFYQKFLRFPGSKSVLRTLLGQSWFIKSSMGYGGCFHDSDCIDREFVSTMITPLLEHSTIAQFAIPPVLTTIPQSKFLAYVERHDQVATAIKEFSETLH